MDLQAAARESFTTGRPCSFICDEHGAGRALEITVHPDGRVSGRPLPPPDAPATADVVEPPAAPAVQAADIWDTPPFVPRARSPWRFRRGAAR